MVKELSVFKKEQVNLDRIQTCDPVKTEKRPGYKHTKLGWIPEEWEIVKLKNVCNGFSGGTPSRSKPEYYGGNIHWIKSGELNQGIITKTSEYITSSGLSNSSAKLIKPKTLLIAMYGATAGVVAISNIEGAINQAVLALILNKKIELHFLHNYLKMKMPKIVQSLVQGGQPNLSGGIINKLNIPLPPLPEQQKIAAILSTWDVAIAKQQQLIAAKQQYKKGLMQMLLTGKKRFEGFEGEWERMRFTDFSELIHGFQFRKDHFVESGYPVIKIGSLVDSKGLTFDNATYISKDDSDKFEAFRLFKGDVLMALTGGTLGKVAIIEDDYGKIFQNYRVGKFVPKRKCTKEYLSQLLQSFYVQQRVQSLVNEAAQPNFGKQDFNKIWIPLPSIEEQKVIASFLIKSDKEIELLQKKLLQLQEQKRGLMQGLLTGTVRVNT